MKVSNNNISSLSQQNDPVEYSSDGNEKFKKTSDVCAIARLELSKVEEMDDLVLIGTTIDEQLDLCRQNSRQIKQENNLALASTETLGKIKELKNNLYGLQGEVCGRKKLLENRQKLYGSVSLNEKISFERKIKELCKVYPELSKGLEHLDNVLKMHMRTSKGTITKNDLEQLKELRKRAIDKSSDLVELLDKEIGAIQKGYENKQNLVGDLAKQLSCVTKPFSSWPVEEKIIFYANVQQYLFNPFEPPIDPEDFIRYFDKNTPEIQSLCKVIHQEMGVSTIKKEFWDFVPLFEKKAQALAAAENKKDVLCQAKVDGLKRIIAQNETSHGEDVLIIGGGPGGLMRALALSVMGNSFHVVERRESHQQNRQNVITLGKNDSKDLTMLLFFGILNVWDKEQSASFSHLKPHLLEVKIGDVETALKQTLKEIGKIDSVHFSTELQTIENREGKSLFVIRDLKEQSFVKIIEPSLVVVTDGAGSPTREQLGISKIVVADTTQIAYSILKAPVEQPSKLKYTTVNFLKSTALILSTLVNAVLKRCTLEEAFGQTIKGGPTAIFRIPEYDYLIRCLREEEHADNDQYKDQLAILDGKIKRHEAKFPVNKEKIERLKKERVVLADQLEKNLEANAQKMHGEIDVFSALYSANHRIKPMQVSKNYLVDIFVGRAERNFVKVGNTPVILRGDASHTTDPYSGYGCKTAFEETLSDQYIFGMKNPGQMNDLENAVQCGGHEFYLNSMINQGLRERSLYRSNTELLQRYTDLALRNGLMDEKDVKFFEYLCGKAKEKFPLTAIEVKFIVEVEKKLKNELIDRRLDVDSLDASWQTKLKKSEKMCLKAFLQGSSERGVSDQMSLIAAKMAFENDANASLVGLLLAIQMLQNSR